MSFSWHDAPLVRLVIPLLLGCATGNYLSSHFYNGHLVILPVIVLIGIFIARKDKWKHPSQSTFFGLLICAAFFLVGISLSVCKKQEVESKTQLSQSADYHLATVARSPERGINSIKTELFITSYSIDRGIVFYEKTRKAICYAPIGSGLENFNIGDGIIFSDRVQMPDEPINPGQFNYANYLKQNSYTGSVYLGSGFTRVAKDFAGDRTTLSLRTLQHRATELFEKHGMDSRELGIASALVLGNKVLLERDLKNQYADAGVVHILAVSGLHVGIIYLFLSFALNAIFRKKFPVVKLLLILVFLWVYAGITGLSPSVMRAATMFSFVALGGLSKKKANTYNMLAASAILLILINPGIVFQVGFQLSYLAVIGIVFIYRRIYPLLVFKSLLADKVWSLVVVSVGAQLATFPLSLYYFNQFPLIFLVTNLIIIPLATAALYSGLLFLVFHWLPGVDWIVYKVFNGVLWCMNSFIEWVAGIPYAVVRNIEFSFGEMVLTYIFIVAAIAAYTSPRKVFIRAALMSLLAISIVSAVRTTQNITRWQLAVLQGRNAPIVCIQKGRSLTVLSHEETQSEFHEANAFYIEGFIRERGLGDMDYMTFSASHAGDFISIDNGTLLIPNKTVQFPKSDFNGPGVSNCLGGIFITDRYTDLKIFENCAYNSTAILGVELPEWKRKKIIALLEKKGISYWDMKEKGVYLQDVF